MSENNPFDDEEQLDESDEFFSHDVGSYAVPDEDQEIDHIIPRSEVIADVIEQLKKVMDNPHLSIVHLSLEYEDKNGYSSWTNHDYYLPPRS
jgi:hypothetical protein